MTSTPGASSPLQGTIPYTSFSLFCGTGFNDIVPLEHCTSAYIKIHEVHDKKTHSWVYSKAIWRTLFTALVLIIKTQWEKFLSGLSDSNSCNPNEKLCFSLMDAVNYITGHAFSLALPSRRFRTKFVTYSHKIIR